MNGTVCIRQEMPPRRRTEHTGGGYVVVCRWGLARRFQLSKVVRNMRGLYRGFSPDTKRETTAV